MMTIEEINKLIADSMFADIGFIDANGSPSMEKLSFILKKNIKRSVGKRVMNSTIPRALQMIITV